MSKGVARAWRSLTGRVRGMLGRTDDREFDAELEEHLHLLAERFERQGLAPDEALIAARRQFGNTTRLREDRWELQTIAVIESLWIDLRHAGR
ncbi:MAG TPA: permease prefix domain 1-containing protein, partial [Vicinamibacterales bacterium]